MDTLRTRMRIYGRVQGVGFRSLARREALTLSLSGFVRNENDGSLIIEIEGDRASVDSFVEWAKRGPSRAQVERVEIESIVSVSDDGFVIT
ncbi:MAG: acylphosphatase [Candidatus Moraniibacteriota bacterium]